MNVVSISENIDLNDDSPFDFDPHVDINITVTISAIRAIDQIDVSSEADFFVKLFINDEEFSSPVWENTNYVYDSWSVSKNVADDVKQVSIVMQLWDAGFDQQRLCDIGRQSNENTSGFVSVISYDISTGQWNGDDYLQDASGYGRVNGCDDGSVYEDERDCEIWFNVFQNDFDADGIPYWIEQYEYGTDPNSSDLGCDADEDGIPIEWEHHWGYDPFVWDDHQQLDPDQDSISNHEEFLTWDNWSDPFRKDIFLEIDFMEDGPSGEVNTMPVESREIMKEPFHGRNIMYHVDTEIDGGEYVAFDNFTEQDEILDIYQQYFLHNGEKSWKRGVYHYGIFVYHCKPNGFAFAGDGGRFWGYGPGTNSFIIESKTMERIAERLNKPLPHIYASSVVHEMGHNFGIRFGHPFGCDNRHSTKPWFVSFWLFLNYKSIMNYFYTYDILDFSDGSHGVFDFDDWSAIDLSYFEAEY